MSTVHDRCMAWPSVFVEPGYSGIEAPEPRPIRKSPLMTAPYGTSSIGESGAAMTATEAQDGYRRYAEAHPEITEFWREQDAKMQERGLFVGYDLGVLPDTERPRTVALADEAPNIQIINDTMASVLYGAHGRTAVWISIDEMQRGVAGYPLPTSYSAEDYAAIAGTLDEAGIFVEDAPPGCGTGVVDSIFEALHLDKIFAGIARGVLIAAVVMTFFTIVAILFHVHQ